MCVRIAFSPAESFTPWDAEECVITVPTDLTLCRAVIVVRAILAELAVVQPEFGAVCWCGADVDLLPRVPEQRRSSQVITYGA